MSKNFNRNNQQQNQNRTRINDWIRVPNVMVIHEGKNLGVMSTDAAKRLAREAELDLVEVVADKRPPICKIMDYDKYRYELSVKEKDIKKKQKQNQLKELRLSPSIGDHDLSVKINQGKLFLEEGSKVQFRLEYKRRENAHKDLGFEVINKVVDALNVYGTLTQKPRLEGSVLHCVFEPLKKE